MSECVVVGSFLPWVEICRWHAKRIEITMSLWGHCDLPQLAGFAFFVVWLLFFSFFYRSSPSLSELGEHNSPRHPCLSLFFFASICFSVSLWTALMHLAFKTEDWGTCWRIWFQLASLLFFFLSILVVQIFVLFWLIFLFSFNYVLF